ncbi:MAG: mycofactocin-coupled SDR family oxidoreductase [Aeromicrobium sp.]
MGRFDGQVVLISGVARGQGRSHALRFAQEGAAVIGFDLCADQPEVAYDLATAADLAETEDAVRAAGGSILTRIADVRDIDQIRSVVADGVAEFGGVDILLANAAVLGGAGPLWEIDDAVFQNVIETDLIGVWKTIKVAVPEILKREGHRSVIVTGSGASVKGSANIGDYVTAKHGLIGLVRTLARELGPHGVRANAVLPGNVDTQMLQNAQVKGMYFPGAPATTREVFADAAAAASPLRVPWVDPSDISEAVLWLASPESRYVTGTALSVDAGTAIP